LTYTSNSIEGNTLTLIEISIIINDKQSVAGKSLREVNEALNHALAWDYITDTLSLIPLKKIKISQILELHNIILNNIDNSEKGKFRNERVRISGSNTILPNPLKVDSLMNDLIGKINKFKNQNLEEIINFAILIHFEMVKIHPFIYGNGRTSRLLMNSILKHFNLPPLSVEPKHREQYLKSLEESDFDKPNPFLEFMISQYSENLDNYLKSFE
jgi:Fic family protein